MVPCIVSVDSPMATCITYELPGSLLKLIDDEGASAVSLQRVALPTVSILATIAEFHYSGCSRDVMQSGTEEGA
jgi:hypothetical protein